MVDSYSSLMFHSIHISIFLSSKYCIVLYAVIFFADLSLLQYAVFSHFCHLNLYTLILSACSVHETIH